MQPTPEFIQTLVLKAVRQHVAAAVQSRLIISAADCAAEIVRTYPACTLNQAELINEIALAAAKAGLAVDLGPPERGRITKLGEVHARASKRSLATREC
jgi:hypothetical protein